MSVIYATSLKTTRMQSVADAIAGGSLVIGDNTLSGSTGVLSTITLSATAATVSGATLTLSGVPLAGTATAAGTPAKAEFRNSSGVTITSGLTAGTSGADIIVSASPFTLNGPVTVTAGTIIHG